MNNLTQDKLERLEAMQEQAFSLTNIPIEQAIAKAKANKRLGSPDRPRSKNITPQSLFPEYVYDTSDGWFERMGGGVATKYEEIPLMQRMWNIIPLCHEVYTQFFDCQKIDIPVSTLPFMDLSGYACEFEDKSHAVFLNDGLLGALPALFHYLIPILNPDYFDRKPDGNFTLELINLLINLTEIHFSQIDSTQSTKLRYPSSNDGWYLKHLLKQNLIKGEEFEANPGSIPLSDGQALHYACRSAYIFILAHEFAHIYGGHHHFTDMSEPPVIRDPNIMKLILHSYRGVFDEYNLDTALLFDHWFGTYQPLEEQADALALQCVLYYITKNELNEQQADCMLLGLIGLFFVMEMIERFLLYNSFSHEGLTKITQMPWEVRNIAIQAHHPAPLMRLFLATVTSPNSEQSAMEEVRQAFSNMEQMFQPLWEVIEPALPEIEGAIDVRGVFGVDRSRIFSGGVKTTHLRTSFIDREKEIEALLRLNRG